MGVALGGRLTAAERRGVVGVCGFEAGDFAFVGDGDGDASSPASGEGISCPLVSRRPLRIPEIHDRLQWGEGRQVGTSREGSRLDGGAGQLRRQQLVQGKRRAFVVQHGQQADGGGLRLNGWKQWAMSNEHDVLRLSVDLDARSGSRIGWWVGWGW